jgi:hypothetical protein
MIMNAREAAPRISVCTYMYHVAQFISVTTVPYVGNAKLVLSMLNYIKKGAHVVAFPPLLVN